MKKIIIGQLLVLFLAACIGEDFVERDRVFAERLTIVTNNDDNSIDALIVGDTLHLNAIFINADGEEEMVNLVWESSNPEFAIIHEGNQLIAVAKGVTTISVSYAGLREEMLVEIDQLERIELSVSSSSLQVGQKLTPTGRYFNKDGVETPAVLSYSSSNPSVASLNSNNELEALQVGQTILTATFNNIVSNPVNVAVVADTVSVASLSISPASGSIMEGETIQFSAVARNINGTVIPNAPITWNSTNPSILSIDNTGLGTGNAVGSSNVTASSGNATSSSSSVLVNPMVTTTRTGTFTGTRGYSVSGTVTMSTLPNGSLQLSFSGFSSSNGPGLYIYLSNTTNGGISIERLNRRTGNFTVNLPSSIGILDYNNVLIWCQPFGLTFGYANLN